MCSPGTQRQVSIATHLLNIIALTHVFQVIASRQVAGKTPLPTVFHAELPSFNRYEQQGHSPKAAPCYITMDWHRAS